MKKVKMLLCVLMLAAFSAVSVGCVSEPQVSNQGTDKVSSQSSAVAESQGETETASKSETDNTENTDNTRLGDYGVEIKSCRLDKDYEGDPVAIITYGFTNFDSDPAAFYTSLSETVYQDGVGLTEAYILDDDSDYNSDNQMKEIKTGVTLDVEVAYELNNEASDLEVEVTEWISFSDDKITKTFKIA